MSNFRRDSNAKPMKRGSTSSSLASSTSAASAIPSVSSQCSSSFETKPKDVRRPSLPKKAPSTANSIASARSIASKTTPPASRSNSISRVSAKDRRDSAASIKSARRGSGTELFQMFAILATYGCGGHYRILPDPVPVFNKEGGIDVTYVTGGGPGRHSAVSEWEVKLLRKFGLPKLSKPASMPGAKLNKRLIELFTTKFIVFMCDNGETCIIPNPEALEDGDLEES